jgi:hypothetical protein
MGTTRRQFTDGEQRDATMRRAAIAAPAAAHAPCPIAIPRFDRCLQLQLDQPQYMPVNDASGHRFERVRMRNRVEIFRQISVNHAGVVPANQPVRFLDRVDRAAARAIAIGIVLEARLEVRFQHDLGGGLNHAVPDSRDTEWTFAATRPRDRHPPHRIRPVRLRDEVLAQARQPSFQTRRLDLLKGHPVNARRTRIGAGQCEGGEERANGDGPRNVRKDQDPPEEALS